MAVKYRDNMIHFQKVSRPAHPRYPIVGMAFISALVSRNFSFQLYWLCDCVLMWFATWPMTMCPRQKWWRRAHQSHAPPEKVSRCKRRLFRNISSEPLIHRLLQPGNSCKCESSVLVLCLVECWCWGLSWKCPKTQPSSNFIDICSDNHGPQVRPLGLLLKNKQRTGILQCLRQRDPNQIFQYHGPRQPP